MLNFNPMRWFELITQILIVLAIISLAFFTVIATNGTTLSIKHIFYGLAVPAVGFCINIFCTILSLIIIKYYESNFVSTDEFDNLVYPERHLTLSIAKKSNYLREGNVFMSELDGKDFHIYLVNKAKSEFHICGIDGEPECLLTLIREKQERGEKVILPLTFEGKFVGNAEVSETFASAEER